MFKKQRKSSRPSPQPTRAEIAILQVLWQLGPATVRQIHEKLSRERATGYTTILKLLQIMTTKGLVTRTEQGQAHVYQAAYSEASTQQELMGDLVDRAFGGSASKLVLQALSSRPATAEERAKIRRLLDELEKEVR